MRLLQEFANIEKPKTVDFCREAYKFLTDECTEQKIDAPDDHKERANPTAIGTVTPIDLGLPSGTLWADRNVGAKSPTDFGAYFSWGNTAPNYPKNGNNDWGDSENAFDRSFTADEYQITEGAKWNKDLDLQHDAAYMNTDGVWKMPTKEQFKELHDNCTVRRKTINGVNGLLFTSNINGNTLFFPAAGFGYSTSLDNRGSRGYYWSRSWYSSGYGYYLYFNSSYVYPQHSRSRYFGYSVRAVQDLPTK